MMDYVFSHQEMSGKELLTGGETLKLNVGAIKTLTEIEIFFKSVLIMSPSLTNTFPIRVIIYIFFTIFF